MSESNESKTPKAQEELDVLSQAFEEFKSLQEHPGWKRLLTIMENQQQLRTNAVLFQDLTSIEGILKGISENGERKGITLVVSFPKSACEGLERDIKMARAAVIAEHEAGLGYSEDNHD